MTVVDYDPDLVKVVRDGHTTVDLLTVVDDVSKRQLSDPIGSILRPDWMTTDQDSLPKTYTDPALRNRLTLLGLIRKLCACGLIVFSSTRHGAVGLFFCSKKGRVATACM